MVLTIARRNEGVILIVVLGILALLCLVGVAIVTTARVENDASTSYVGGTQAKLICEAALQSFMRDIENDLLRDPVTYPEVKYDAYGKEDWFFPTGDLANTLCRGGTASATASGVTGTLTDNSGFSGLTLDGMIVVPNANKRQSFQISGNDASQITAPATLTESIGSVAGAGDSYQVFGAYKFETGDSISVDVNGDGTNDSKWIDYEVGDQWVKGRYALCVEDQSGKINANLAGNLSDRSGPVHNSGSGFDSFDISLQRLAQAVAATTGTEITDAQANSVSTAIVQKRGGGTNTTAFGLGDDCGSLPKAGTITALNGNIAMFTWGAGAPTENGIPIFAGRSGLTCTTGGNDYRIVDCSANVMVLDRTPGVVAFTVERLDDAGISGFDPSDPLDRAANTWTPYDELDQKEMHSSSAYSSPLEGVVETANAGTWDLIRNHLTTYTPQGLSYYWGKAYRSGAAWTAKPNLSNSATTTASIEAALTAGGNANNATREKLVGLIMDWVDEDCEFGKPAGMGYYGLEAHPVLCEIGW